MICYWERDSYESSALRTLRRKQKPKEMKVNRSKLCECERTTRFSLKSMPTVLMKRVEKEPSTYLHTADMYTVEGAAEAYAKVKNQGSGLVRGDSLNE